eukprot:SAG11_NODE_269_length_11407_cov_13.825964_6_plen_97_part_00
MIFHDQVAEYVFSLKLVFGVVTHRLVIDRRRVVVPEFLEVYFNASSYFQEWLHKRQLKQQLDQVRYTHLHQSPALAIASVLSCWTSLHRLSATSRR